MHIKINPLLSRIELFSIMQYLDTTVQIFIIPKQYVQYTKLDKLLEKNAIDSALKVLKIVAWISKDLNVKAKIVQ